MVTTLDILGTHPCWGLLFHAWTLFAMAASTVGDPVQMQFRRQGPQVFVGTAHRALCCRTNTQCHFLQPKETSDKLTKKILNRVVVLLVLLSLSATNTNSFSQNKDTKTNSR
jgi:hypothetical protein